MRRAAILALALLASGCVYQGKSKHAGSDLERAIRFIEIDERDRHHDLSQTGLEGEALLEATTGAERVPDPRQVDVNSTIQVKIDPDRLRPADGSDVLSEKRSRELLERKALIRSSLESLGAAIELRRQAVEAFAELKRVQAEGGDVEEARVDFRRQRRAFARDEAKAIGALLEAWESDPVGFVQLDEAAEDPSYQNLQEFLRREVEAIDREHEELLEDVEQRQFELQLTAYLESGDQRTAVHLPGYDNLAAGEARGRDRLGLDLSPEEMDRLQEQWQETRELAEAAEAVRTGQRELREALEEQVRAVAPRLGSALDRALELEQRLEALDLETVVEETRADLRELAARIEAAGEELGESAASRAERFPRQWAERVSVLAEIRELVRRVEALAASWRAVEPSRLLELVASTSQLVADVQAQLEQLRGMQDFHEGRTAFREVLDSSLRGLEEEALAQVGDLLDAPAAQRLSENFAKLREVWLAGEQLVRELDALVGGLAPPVLGHVDAPHAFRIPVDDVQDTTIDLSRTPRQAGDRLSFRAQLYRGGADASSDQMEASFEPHYFGWNARLSPSVVLVRPTSLDGAEEQFAFAPALSWVHGYEPRPEDDGFWNGLARGLDPALGIHASFVNFDPDTSIEIGLGATLSFWRDRLQLGFGINLMATDDSGRYYSFVGSDLISLLNTIGIGG